MNSSELRQKYLDFFKKHGHAIIPSASLIPVDTGENQTSLFTTAGMQPLIPYLMGQPHSGGTKLVNYQKCIRTGDIDDVGDDTHLTFFEMLGNWSLGDYWKKESITWSFEFLTSKEWLSIDKNRLAVSCFAGDADAPRDEESAEIWKSLGFTEQRIAFLPKADNWWGPVGDSGPCGPDTEIFYWKLNDEPVPETFDPTNKNWVEIWNNVFMQYFKDKNGNYVLAEQKNVDTGMGLERITAVLNGFTNVYQIDTFQKILEVIPEKAQFTERQKRIIADHCRAATFMIADGIIPSNKERGYVLRRLIRRVVAYYYQGDMHFTEVQEKEFLSTVLGVICREYKLYYDLNFQQIEEIFNKEKAQFLSKIKEGTAEYLKLSKESNIDVKSAFLLYQSFGLPFDLLKELDPVKTKDLKHEDFEAELKKHQDLSRTASAGMFKGGLADHSAETVRLHTAHHLLLATLQELFGKQVKQRGSNINAERLRIDFSFDRKLTDEEKKKVEDMVNEKIQAKLPVVKKEMPKEEAEKIGAEMEFGVKYGNTVSVYFIEDGKGNVVSKEFCGGPHVNNTSELGKFKILKEEAVSSGVRRIKAVLQT